MNNIWLNLLVIIIRKLIEPGLWEDVRNRVAQAEHLNEKTGEEKRAWVSDQIQYGATWMTNLAIEVAVALMRAKQ